MRMQKGEGENTNMTMATSCCTSIVLRMLLVNSNHVLQSICQPLAGGAQKELEITATHAVEVRSSMT